MTRELERFWERVQVANNGCWLWLGPLSGGYGSFCGIPAYRWAYEFFVGPIPDGLDIDHACHNDVAACAGGVTCLHRSCVNPAHLSPSTRSDNLKRSGHMSRGLDTGFAVWQRAKTHCPQGHEYSPENTYVSPSRPSARYCRECHRLHTRTRRARLRQR